MYRKVRAAIGHDRIWRVDAKAPDTPCVRGLLRLFAALEQLSKGGDDHKHQHRCREDVDLAAGSDSCR